MSVKSLKEFRRIALDRTQAVALDERPCAFDDHKISARLRTMMNGEQVAKPLRPLLVLALCLGSLLASAQAPQRTPSSMLRERFLAVSQRAVDNPFREPVYLKSSQASGRLQGEIYAMVGHPFDKVRQAVATSDNWCRILILHLNVKYCRASNLGARQVLDVGIGRKFDQPLADAHWARFHFRSTATGKDYLALELRAPTGPMGTRDYRIVVEAAPLDAGRSVVHMTYSYAYSATARWAMQTYLATLGNGKVGFSVVGRERDGQPKHVGGVLGIIERNTMRYYLAIEAYLGVHALPPPQQLRKSLEDWFSATERYALQLHEVERSAYLEMKLREAQRQQSEPPHRD
jgi:hypothetical protein